MKHVIQLHLEHKTDVIREIEIPSKRSLKDLHNIIIENLKLDKNEMASFYITNEDLELLEEIPIFKIDTEEKSMSDMTEIPIESVFPNINSQLIYIYDFLKMWRFLISYSKVTENKSDTIDVINCIGEMPKKAPEIMFKTKEGFDAQQTLNEFDYDEDFENINETEY